MTKREAKRLATQYAAAILNTTLASGGWIGVLDANGFDPDADGQRFDDAFQEVIEELSNRYGGMLDFEGRAS